MEALDKIIEEDRDQRPHGTWDDGLLREFHNLEVQRDNLLLENHSIRLTVTRQSDMLTKQAARAKEAEESVIALQLALGEQLKELQFLRRFHERVMGRAKKILEGEI